MCRHRHVSARPGRAPVLSTRPVPGWGWGSATKPAQQTPTAKTFRGMAEHRNNCRGPEPLLSVPDDRRPLHPGPDGSPPLRRGKGAPPLDRAPEMPRFSERPLLLGTLEGWWMGPVRTRRSSPAWPSSWPLSTGCCPGGSPRVPLLPQSSPALAVGGRRGLHGPPLLREQASVRPPPQLQSPGSGLCVRVLPLWQRCPCLGPTSGCLGGRPWLWGWFTPHSLQREGVTPWSQGGEGSVTAASREKWACAPGPALPAAPQGA